ncbi:hypothetical protein [Pseudorhodoferax sp. Leaf274]|uniref:hypothetical protein n=1 Tax=Pseudorhodoferax sp. Leaf274 TaxID=1736318 RepID=UPI0012E22A6C|nr:hypothetical protein [Pseudorhodoferax sp. Leaf274]
MRLIIAGMVIDAIQSPAEPSTPAPLVSEPHLVMYVHRGTDHLVVIPLTPRTSAKRTYFVGPRRLSLKEAEEQLDLNKPLLNLGEFKPRGATFRTDDQLNEKFKRGFQVDSIALLRLKARWALISTLVQDSSLSPLLLDSELRPGILLKHARTALLSPELCKQIANLRSGRVECIEATESPTAKELDVVVRMLQRLLNQYWAGGSRRGALIGSADRCGGRGKHRKAGAAKRGAPNARTRAGEVGREGINVEENGYHHKIIAFCYTSWVFRGQTVAKALRRMWTEFYSIAVQMPDGTIKREWLPDHERPTESHFRTWGQGRNRELAAWRLMLAPKSHERNYRAVLGSASDDLYDIGQRGSMDSTSIDVELVRALDRIQRIGSAHRILLVENMFGYIAGLYQGLEAAASKTVRLAAFNAADPDKEGWLKDISMDKLLSHEDFLPIWFQSIISDNTDLRSEEIMNCLSGIGTHVHYVPVNEGNRNSLAEAGHHILHRLSDHNLPGTTHGQKKARGERSAESQARCTNIEALRASVYAIHLHNTEEMKDFRSLDLRWKNVPPTRLALTREFIRQGRVARASQSVDLLRRQLLPTHWGTFTEQGVRLHRRNERKNPQFINHICYVANHPIINAWCEDARRGGKDDPEFFRGQFIVHPFHPRRIWYVDPATNESIELNLKVLKIRDPDLPYVMTLSDMVDRDAVEAAEAMDSSERSQRQRGDMEAWQREQADQAKQKYDADVARAGKEPNKREMKENKRTNREAEHAETIMGVAIDDSVLSETAESTPAPPIASQSTLPSASDPSPVTEVVGPPDHMPTSPRSSPRRSLLSEITASQTLH